MKTNIITAFFCCVSFMGFSQSKAFQGYQDSLRTVFNTSKDITTKIKSGHDLAIPILTPTQQYIMPSKR